MSNLLLTTTGGAISTVVALIIIILSAYLGLKNGFAKTFLKTFGVILSILFAVALCSKGAELLQKQFGLVEIISSWIKKFIENIFGSDLMNRTLQSATEESLLESGAAGWIVNIVLNTKDKIGSGSLSEATLIIDVISPAFAYYIVMAISAILLYIIFRVIFYLLGETIKKLHKVVLVGTVDGFLGFLIGTIKGLALVQIIVLILGAIPIPFVQDINGFILESEFVSFLNTINIFSILLNLFGETSAINVIVSIIS